MQLEDERRHADQYKEQNEKVNKAVNLNKIAIRINQLIAMSVIG